MEKESLATDFWEHPDKAKKTLQELEMLRKIVGRYEKLAQDILDVESFLEIQMNKEETSQIEAILLSSEQEMEFFEKLLLFSQEYDENDAFVTIQSGAGGVDAQDWAEMLLRMYLRFSERNDFSAVLVDESRGGEAGIKSATLQVSGPYSYGNLKQEAGTHRLVRLSPFNSDQLRQTSFARVEVLPIIEAMPEVQIDEKELRIDTFRASGAGGQHVNKTDSAVRITHEPTGIVVSCQSERSQAQNKERAMALLLAKLHRRALEERKKESEAIRGEQKSAEWGSQIRSYVLHPYTLVKDHRTGVETPQTKDVLDGDIDNFIQAMLKKNAKHEEVM